MCSTHKTKGGWDKRTIATLEFPVAMRLVESESSLFIALIHPNSYADISGNGFNDGTVAPNFEATWLTHTSYHQR